MQLADTQSVEQIGIPMFMIAAMKVMKMKKIVKEKMENAAVSALLALMMKRGCSHLSHQMSRLVGNVFEEEDEKQFEEQCTEQFRKLLVLQIYDGDQEISPAKWKEISTRKFEKDCIEQFDKLLKISGPEKDVQIRMDVPTPTPTPNETQAFEKRKLRLKKLEKRIHNEPGLEDPCK